MHGIRGIFTWVGVCSAVCGLVTVEARAADNVRVDGGTLEGVVGTDPTVRVFKGVPFAAPPVGDRRWKAPQPVPAWGGVRKADEWSTRCMQGPMWGPLVSREREMGEDCLYLNVWTTARSAKEKRPVLVVFHGGGFAAGSASEPRCDGEWFAKQGIVVVAPNYRLSLFGFMAHPELTRESGGKGSGNYGMLDQAAALQWVQRNVAAFGGDPGNVTINGESAGSLSVSALMVSPLTKKLVHKAIGQSGAFFTSPTGGMAEKSLVEKEQDGVMLAASVGAGSLAELRAKPAAELLAAAMKMGGWGYSPGVDGYFLPEKTAAMYAAGRQTPIPLLAGWTSSEMGMSVAMNPQKPTPQTFPGQLKRQLGSGRKPRSGSIPPRTRKRRSGRRPISPATSSSPIPRGSGSKSTRRRAMHPSIATASIVSCLTRRSHGASGRSTPPTSSTPSTRSIRRRQTGSQKTGWWR